MGVEKLKSRQTINAGLFCFNTRNIISDMNQLVVFKWLLAVLLFINISARAQTGLQAPGAVITGQTVYGDKYALFCVADANNESGILSIESPFAESTDFSWEKYNEVSGSFEAYFGNIESDTLQSTASRLENGAYRVLLSAGGSTSTSEVRWVLNNWIQITHIAIPDSTSNCDYFKTNAEYDAAPLNIIALASGENYSLRDTNPGFTFEWSKDGVWAGAFLSTTISPPIASDTPVKYDLKVSDAFGCSASASVDYISKVTDAQFVADQYEGEAVLEVGFQNNSINYDSAYWYFYKDTWQISLEIEEGEGAPVDSIDFVLKEDAPMHEYKMAGEYIVKLVSVKVNETGNCYDSVMISPYISVLETLVEVPNAFSPNGDNVNDQFVVKAQSLKEMKIWVYNRWGGLVHSWSYSNITSSDKVYEHAVWDGRIGNRMATPGVYYYVIKYQGRQIDRDGVGKGRPIEGTEKGFFHLFRGK